MARTVADQFVETLAAAGVKRIYGIVGDSLNGLTDAVRRQGKIEWVHVRHEEVAAFAAGAEAHLRGELAVCAGSCGPGNLHLINGLFDCHRSRVPVLGIAAHYDVSNDFYELFLDRKYMFCTCADFPTGQETIEEAQAIKANHLLNLIDPRPGEKILELGCGALVIPEQVAIPQAETAFDDMDNINDTATANLFRAQLARLVEMAKLLAGA